MRRQESPVLHAQVEHGAQSAALVFLSPVLWSQSAKHNRWNLGFGISEC